MADQIMSVGGYQFQTEAEAQKAQMELHRIQFFDSKIDYRNIENVRMLYEKIVKEKPFQTQIGLDYVRKLREILRTNGIPEEELAPIDVKVYSTWARRNEREARQSKKVEMVQTNHMKQTLRISMLLNLFLGVLVIAMLLITLKSDNPNILNYKTNITNQYAAWEQELKAREDAVRAKELRLKIENEESQ